jgi:hypothetical protein
MKNAGELALEMELISVMHVAISRMGHIALHYVQSSSIQMPMVRARNVMPTVIRTKVAQAPAINLATEAVEPVLTLSVTSPRVTRHSTVKSPRQQEFALTTNRIVLKDFTSSVQQLLSRLI